MSKLEVGQRVFLEPGINVARYNKSIREGEILKVGRKYFEVGLVYKDGTVMKSRPYKYHIEDLTQKTDYCADYNLYLNKQDILDKKEKSRLYMQIEKYFSRWSSNKDLSLDKLRKIKDILEG